MSSWNHLVLAWSLAACGGRARPEAVQVAASAPELDRVDVYGSRQLDRDRAIAVLGPRLVELVHAVERGEPEPLRTQVSEQIRHLGAFAFVQVGSVTYYAPRRTFVEIDLVDEPDRAARMAFAPAPTGEVADPDGLVALWMEYETAQRELLETGEITKVGSCPFWHCLTFDHPSLEHYRDAFATRVPHVVDALARMLREDRSSDHRAAAAFLLAHIASGERVVELMLPAIRDPETLVRNNALRVLAVIALAHREIAVPVAPILDALRFPTTTDRNKAAAILTGLTDNPRLPAADRALIRTRAGDVLVDMLALRSPNNHDFAYRILKNLAGRDLGEHAIAAWRTWVRGG